MGPQGDIHFTSLMGLPHFFQFCSQNFHVGQLQRSGFPDEMACCQQGFSPLPEGVRPGHLDPPHVNDMRRPSPSRWSHMVSHPSLFTHSAAAVCSIFKGTFFLSFLSSSNATPVAVRAWIRMGSKNHCTYLTAFPLFHRCTVWRLFTRAEGPLCTCRCTPCSP